MTFHDSHLASGADSGRAIVEALGGHWTARGGMCRCPAHADTTPSLSVRPGKRRLLFHCFAGCETRDVLDAIAALRLPGSARLSFAAERSLDTHRPAVERLWSEARALGDGLAARYLAGRGLTGTSALRFHPRTPQGRQPLTRFLPAMIAAVTDETGLVALHRTFLSPDGRTLSSRQPSRAALGPLGTGLVRLHPVSDRLGLAEGIETALSATRLFGVPCWATLGAERFKRIALPGSIAEIVLFLDHDAAGHQAEAVARERFAGRRIEARYPTQPGADWNDVLRARPQGTITTGR
jgi:putative DNA primase/helicase